MAMEKQNLQQTFNISIYFTFVIYYYMELDLCQKIQTTALS